MSTNTLESEKNFIAQKFMRFQIHCPFLFWLKQNYYYLNLLQNGLTQNQVAESLGVTPGYISNVENNRTAMSLRILIYYARLMGCSLDSLVGKLEPEYSETALDRKLFELITRLDTETKEKILKTIELWSK